VISLVLAATACGVSVRPRRWAKTDNRGVPGTPCCVEPRSGLPSTTLAASGAAGVAGVGVTPLAAQTPHVASHPSQSKRRKIVCSVEAQGV